MASREAGIRRAEGDGEPASSGDGLRWARWTREPLSLGRVSSARALRAAAAFHEPQGVTGPQATRQRDAIFRSLLALADLTALFGACAVAAVLEPRSLKLPWAPIVGLPFLLAGANCLRLYERDEAVIRKSTLDELPRIFQLATLWTLIALLAGLVGSGPSGHDGALALWLALAALTLGSRTAARALALHLAPRERCLFIGDVSSARALRAKLAEGGNMAAAMVAHLDLDEATSWSRDPFEPDKLIEIRELVDTLDIHRAIIGPGGAEDGEMLELISALQAVGVRVTALPRLLELAGTSLEFEDLHGMTAIGLRPFELTRGRASVKRALDLIGASAGLLAVAPLMALIALAIKIDSRGPVFFRQLRVGRRGRRFYMLKFRTMVPEAEALKASLAGRNEALDGLFKIADDPRTTGVGKLLRKTCLDELPQLINILRGEMGLVGPRPLIAEEDVLIEGRLRRRLEVLPGMTGNWQILGPARVPLLEMAAIDYRYVGNWSLWSDVKVLVRTVSHVVARRGM